MKEIYKVISFIIFSSSLMATDPAQEKCFHKGGVLEKRSAPRGEEYRICLWSTEIPCRDFGWECVGGPDFKYNECEVNALLNNRCDSSSCMTIRPHYGESGTLEFECINF